MAYVPNPNLSQELLDALDELADDESLFLEACRQDNLYPIYFEHINAGRMQVGDRETVTVTDSLSVRSPLHFHSLSLPDPRPDFLLRMAPLWDTGSCRCECTS